MNTKIDENYGKQIKDKVKEDPPSRRVVLRGALAVGCGLLLPAVLLGCDSKKSANPTSAEPASPPATSAEPAAAAATGKWRRQQKCSGCANFIAESNTCKLIDGQISPDGWCSLWTKKPTIVLTAIRTRPALKPTDNIIRRTT